MNVFIAIADMTDYELEKKIYETEETHDNFLRQKLLKERNRRSCEE